MSNKITEEHIKDVYIKFINYFKINKNNFFNKVQKHIVEDIKNEIYNENKFTWNDTSLNDYLNDLIYMLKGQAFARTINKYAENYFIENICKDLDSEFCNKSKISLAEHKKYYKGIQKKNKLPSEFSKGIEEKVNEYKDNVKNIVLYGPPGVGKTHNYQNLISMIEEDKPQKDIFDSISNSLPVELDNNIFQTIKDEKRVEFITFHQSYSYEDFIEGFRPNENGTIELEDGIFKQLSSKALNQSIEVKYNHISFDDAYDILRTMYIDDEINQLHTVTNIKIFIKDYQERFIKVISDGAKNEHYIKRSDLEVVVNGILDNKIDKPARIKDMRVKKDTVALSGYYFPIASKIAEIIKENKIDKKEEQNYYIVIDEINRGNISKIFGELITLIEEDKRDTYEVTLPYSKTSFKVPSNLYIIATMNSTDKSIATIDIALRRRFTFLKMKPSLELVQNQSAKNMMRQLNIYIADKLGEDYQLGHSYFMKVQNDEDLEFVKEYKIKPLLEEYFYADEKSADEIFVEALANINE